jgi:CubicO group peptidase (beta-lactamase class C family)
MKIRYSTALPSALQTALVTARDAGAAIQTVALTPDSEWVVVAANVPCYSDGFPSAPREWIDRYAASGHEIDVVAFGPGGRWLVLAEDLIRRTTSTSRAILENARAASAQGYRATSFAFSDAPDTGWVLTAGGRPYAASFRNVDSGIREAVLAANAGDHDLHEVAIAPGGAWVLVAEDFYASRGLPASLLTWLDRYRTADRRRIDHVVLHPMGGALRWIIVSNTPEPDPDPGDLPDLVEHGLPGDSTIYQRMKQHGITGLSVALIENNEVAWARAYGLREFDHAESYVYPKTVFDAASISKPVTYAAALQLVDSGALDLTETGVLLELADRPLTPVHTEVGILPSRERLLDLRADEIHLAHLLSHCAGIDNQKGTSGAQAFSPNDPLPSIRDIVEGARPARQSNRIVRVDSLQVGEMYDYSGANSVLVQALIEHHASDGYDGQVQDLLDALSMERSTFDTGFWRTADPAWFARGHRTDSTRTTTSKRNVKIYPNQAAANLRSTPSDLAQFVIMLNQGGVYRGRRLLANRTVDLFLGRDGTNGVADSACDDAARGMMSNRRDGLRMQLGISARDQNTPGELFWHRGLNDGYRTIFYGTPQQRGGLVIFLTGSFGEWSQGRDVENMRLEIKNAVENVYGWDL